MNRKEESVKKVLAATAGLMVLALFVAGSAIAGPGCCASKAKATSASAACEGKTEQASACAMKTVKLSIDGMHCPNCREAVQAALTGLDGVCAAKVSYTRKNAQVTYNAASLTEENIVQAVNATGFTVVQVKTADSKVTQDAAKVKEVTATNGACCKAAKKSGT